MRVHSAILFTNHMIAALALLICSTGPARAAADCYVQVAQPHDQPEAGGIGLMYVTYELMLGSAWPGKEIALTCSPGPVAVDHGLGYSGVQNRNGANKWGFKTEIEDFRDFRRWQGPEGNRYVDTMSVTLDLRAGADSLARLSASRSRSWVNLTAKDFDATVSCTVDCILDNATRSFPPIHHVRLEIVGPAKFARLAAVYPIAPAPRRKEY